MGSNTTVRFSISEYRGYADTYNRLHQCLASFDPSSRRSIKIRSLCRGDNHWLFSIDGMKGSDTVFKPVPVSVGYSCAVLGYHTATSGVRGTLGFRYLGSD